MTMSESKRSPPLPRIPWWVGLLLFTGMAVFLLWEEHSVHIMGALPFLLLLACPIIHLFMHGGHGHGHGGKGDDEHSGHHGGGS